jgi:hypothetical protein
MIELLLGSTAAAVGVALIALSIFLIIKSIDSHFDRKYSRDGEET